MSGRIRAALGVCLLAILAACGQSEDEVNPNHPGWAEYETAFLQACKSNSTGDQEAVWRGLCGCALTRIKTSYSLKAVTTGAVSKETVQNIGGECGASLKLIGGRFPDLARDELVSACTAEAGALGDKAGRYCECSVHKLEEGYSFDHVMHGLVSRKEFEAIGTACVAEVGAASRG
ncbi:MAG: hypothetical protein EP340_04640 [Alphaproteobacteria bacterium]|nr:MAG: hypothetical protein EP340_04640 [Alphaproteobacteria bacterium]